MFDSSHRHLLQALLLSLALHAVLLLGVVRVVPARPEISPGTINVVVSSDRAHSPLSASTAKSSAAPSKLRPALKTYATRRQFVEQAPSVPAAETAQPAPSASPDPILSTGGASAPVTLREGVSADDLRQYRLSLAIAARRFKHYPAVARERCWEGTVEVAVSIGVHLTTPEVMLVRSSGQVTLDEQAIAMMTQAARSTSPPESLKGRDVQLVLPVRFSLDGD